MLESYLFLDISCFLTENTMLFRYFSPKVFMPTMANMPRAC
ncbi:hypothetical protein HBZS_107480 [Helicobacter bizzozeronii CCUG 35545]|nr:hypothetical protein HBZS_107480 [Helicobacter bizzozeronii CCUG 35545]